MKAIGQWMDINGEAIYGTKASPFKTPEWGRYTSKSYRFYTHIFQWLEDQKLVVEAQDLQVSRAYLLADKKQKLRFKQTPNGLVIHVPKNAPDASVVAIGYKND